MNYSVTPTMFVQPQMVEPIMYDHRIGFPVRYSDWLKWCASEVIKTAPWRPHVHIV